MQPPPARAPTGNSASTLREYRHTNQRCEVGVEPVTFAIRENSIVYATLRDGADDADEAGGDAVGAITH